MLPQEMSAGRNLITLFSSVNNLSRSFPSPCARRTCTTRRSRRDNAMRARARRIDARYANVAHASGGAAHSDSCACARNATSIIATIASGIGATCEGAARVVANRRRISRRTSAFARKLRELSAAIHHARGVGSAHRAGVRTALHGHDGAAEDAPATGRRARKNPRRFRRGFPGARWKGDQCSSLSSSSAYSSGPSSSLSCSASASSTTNSQPSP